MDSLVLNRLYARILQSERTASSQCVLLKLSYVAYETASCGDKKKHTNPLKNEINLLVHNQLVP